MQHPDCWGECIHAYGFRPPDESGSGGLCPPSPAKAGGARDLCKIYSIAAVRNVAVMLHSFYHGPGLLAAIHTAARAGRG